MGGMLVKMDFRSQSGFNQSSALIQNPSSSRVWEKEEGEELCLNLPHLGVRILVLE